MFVFFFVLRDSWIAFNSKNSGRSKTRLCWITWLFWRWEFHLWWQSTVFGIIWGEHARKASSQWRSSTDGCLCSCFIPSEVWTSHSVIRLQFPPTQTRSLPGWVGDWPTGWGARWKETLWKRCGNQKDEWVLAKDVPNFPFKTSVQLVWSAKTLQENSGNGPLVKAGRRIWINFQERSKMDVRQVVLKIDCYACKHNGHWNNHGRHTKTGEMEGGSPLNW